MKYIDLIAQSLLLAFGAASALYSIHDEKWVMVILMAQFYIGVWQLASSIISLLFDPILRNAKRLHFILSLGYLLSLAVMVVPKIMSSQAAGLFDKLFMTIPAWSLAIFYYFLTWKRILFTRKKSGSFLRHVSF